MFRPQALEEEEEIVRHLVLSQARFASEAARCSVQILSLPRTSESQVPQASGGLVQGKYPHRPPPLTF